MAVRKLGADPDRPPRSIARTAKKVGAAAKKGKIVKMQRKPLRPGQRAKTRAKKARLVTTFTESADVAARVNSIIGADAFRMRSLAQAKILALFTSAERITGCLGGIVRAGRYPRMFRYKPTLRYDFLVLVARPQWDRATDEDKTRIAYHAMRHLGSDTAGRWKTEPHDHEGFYSEVEFFGLRTPEVKKIAEQLDLFGHKPMIETKQKGGE